MLPTERPPPCSSETPQLKNRCKKFITSDERSSDNGDKLDLFESGLGDISQTALKFSLRSYVLSTRDNDIETHWPFSSKNLQICLKHGLKDVLPPFETLESLRNPSPAIKYTDHNTDNLPFGTLENASKNLASKSNRASESNSPAKHSEYSSATANVSRSDVSSIPIEPKSPFPKPASQDFVLEKPESAVRAAKTKRNSNEDLFETVMGAKVCPVCKTFTSSSNTTLNAHIDQCLSGGKLSVIKHRIKPQKMRSMVDIYKRAISCTLEDLNRRNGINWASNLDFLLHDSENNGNDNMDNGIDIINDNNSPTSMNGDDKNKEDGVYFDSNGAKLRILSRLSDVKSNCANEEDDCGIRKLVERDKMSKVVSSKKRKHLSEQNRCSPGLQCCSEVYRAEVNEKEVDRDRHMKPNPFVTIKHWSSSNRTRLKKKKSSERHSKRTTDLRFSSSSDDRLVSDTDQTRRRNKNATLKSVDESEYMPCQMNRAGFFSFGPRDFRDDGNEENRTVIRAKSDFKRVKRSGSSFFGVGRKECGPLPFSVARKCNAAHRRIKKMRRISSSSTFEHRKLPLLSTNPRPIGNEETLDRSEIHAHRYGVLKICKEQCRVIDPSISSGEGGISSDHLNEFSQHKSRVAERDMNSSSTDTTLAHTPNAEDQIFRGPVFETPCILAFDESSEREQETLRFDKVDVNEAEGSYCFDVEAIPIPGPPGSFLPSPGRVSSEELQANSSLTTFIVPLECDRAVDRPKITSGPNSYGDCESPGPNTPVLRLMGKNLTVMNVDEPRQSRVMNDPPDIRSSGVVHNECSSFRRNIHTGPSFFDYSRFHSNFTVLNSNPSRDLRPSFECLDRPISPVGSSHPPVGPGFEKGPPFIPHSCFSKHKENVHMLYPWAGESWKMVENANAAQMHLFENSNENSVRLNLLMPGFPSAATSPGSLTALSKPVGRESASSLNISRGSLSPSNFASYVALFHKDE